MLEVLAGRAEIWLDGVITLLKARRSVLVPAGAWRGFRNTGEETLHVRATLAAPIFEAQYENMEEAGRRWSATLTTVPRDSCALAIASLLRITRDHHREIPSR